MSKIEWTNKTWNPIIGCSKISEGCQNCYAEKMAFRLANIENTEYYASVLKFEKGINNGKLTPPDDILKPNWNDNTYFVKSQLKKPLNRKKPTMYFVCSMGDLFHENVPFEWIDNVFSITQKCLHHTFQILTKRPEIMKDYFDSRHIKRHYHNIWLGVTTENQKAANERIPILFQISASKRFISCEPLLEPINLNVADWLCKGYPGKTMYSYLDWVIAGPETGPKARPMQKEWIESLHRQCKDSNTPFFDKKNILGLNIQEFSKL